MPNYGVFRPKTQNFGVWISHMISNYALSCIEYITEIRGGGLGAAQAPNLPSKVINLQI